MAFIEGKCPKCHEILQMPEDREKIICMFCGEEILIKDARAEFLSDDEPSEEKIEGCWQDYYSQIAEDFPKMLLDIDDPIKNFKKQLFESAFRQYYRNHLYIIEFMDKAYRAAEDKEEFLTACTGDFVKAVKEVMDALPKRKVSDKQFRFNMTMAIYVIPAFKEFRNDSTEAIADRLVTAWNEAFDQQMMAATFETIQSGFRKRWCYITTAVCDSMGKPDDCAELMALREYRDGYLSGLPEGEALIEHYYDMAPTIVNRINKCDDSKEIYKSIYDNYLVPCLQSIERSDYEGCREQYENMMVELNRRYLKTNAD